MRSKMPQKLLLKLLWMLSYLDKRKIQTRSHPKLSDTNDLSCVRYTLASPADALTLP